MIAKFRIAHLVAVVFLCSGTGKLFSRCMDPQGLAAIVRLCLPDSAAWSMKLLQNGVEIQSLVPGCYKSDVSITQRDMESEPPCRESPVRFQLLLVPKLSKRRMEKWHSANRELYNEWASKIKRSEPKVSVMDSKSEEVRQALRQGYHLLPTHHVDHCHDLVVADCRPNDWVSLSNRSAITYQVDLFLENLKAHFPQIVSNVRATYLGTLTRDSGQDK